MSSWGDKMRYTIVVVSTHDLSLHVDAQELINDISYPSWKRLHIHNLIRDRLGRANARGLFHPHCKLTNDTPLQNMSRNITSRTRLTQQKTSTSIPLRDTVPIIAAYRGERGSRPRTVQICLGCIPRIRLHRPNPTPYKRRPPVG